MTANGLLLKSFAALSLTTVALTATASPGAARIGVVEDYKTTIYCVGLDANPGVYTLDLNGTFTKLNTGYIQYSFNNSGGTFVSTELLYGTKDSYGTIYAAKATAAGNDMGPWGETFYKNAGNNSLKAMDMTYDT